MLDLGAGTGKLTRLLPGRVVAAEPGAGMRATFAGGTPLVGATAERLPFASASFDAVVCGQAFHWFDGPAALFEIHRALRPGGRLLLLWNVRERTVEWARRLADLTEPHRTAVPAYRDGSWRHAFDAAGGLFTPLEHAEYPYEHEVDADTMVDRMASISWIGALPDDRRSALLHDIRALFDGMPPRFPAPYHTDVWWTSRQ